MLLYSSLFLTAARAIRNWKIRHEYLGSTRIRMMQEYHRSENANMDDLETFIITITEKLDFERVKGTFKRTFVDETMRQCLRFRYGAAYWMPDDEFSMDRHFILSSERANVMEYLGEMKMAQQNIPSDRPPWQAVIIPIKNQNTYVVVLRVHHLLLKWHPMQFLDPQLSAGKLIDGRRHSKIRNVKDGSGNIIDSFVWLINILKCKFPHFNYTHLVDKQKAEEIWQKMKFVYSVLASAFYAPKLIIGELFPIGNTENPLKMKRSLIHQRKMARKEEVSIAWSQQISKRLVNNIAADSGVTFRDVLLSCCSGSIHHYLGKYICNSPEDVMASVAIASSRAIGSLSVSLTMVTGASDSRDRLSKTMAEGRVFAEDSPSLLMAGWATSAQTLRTFLPQFVVTGIRRLVHRKHAASYTHDVVNTNKIGQVFGDEVVEVLHWSHHSPQIGNFSYYCHFS